MKQMTITIDTDFDGLSVAELLETWLIPRKERYLLLQEKRLLVNGEAVSADKIIAAADRIEFFWQEPELTVPDASLATGPVEILYEDENLIVVNKRENLKTHANSANEASLLTDLEIQENQKFYVVHRLDEATSGCILFAKNSFVLPILSAAFEKHQIHRTYQALVSGHFAQKSFTINAAIGRDRHHTSRQRVSKTGKSAVTHITVIEEMKNTTLVSCQLETGRTHQIRVHLASTGHAVVGDVLYRGEKAARLMLHAKEIHFSLPFSKETLSVSAESASFQAGLDRAKHLM